MYLLFVVYALCCGVIDPCRHVTSCASCIGLFLRIPAHSCVCWVLLRIAQLDYQLKAYKANSICISVTLICFVVNEADSELFLISRLRHVSTPFILSCSTTLILQSMLTHSPSCLKTFDRSDSPNISKKLFRESTKSRI